MDAPAKADFTARPLHIGLSSKISVRDFHFTLQQIRLIGDVSGLSKSSFSLPLNILSREELDARLRKIREAHEHALQEFAQQSFLIGQKIIEADEDADKKLALLGASLDKLVREKRGNKKTTSEKADITEKEQVLKDNIITLKKHKNDLEEANDARLEATSVDELDKVETLVDRLKQKIKNIPHPRDIFLALKQKLRTFLGRDQNIQNDPGNPDGN